MEIHDNLLASLADDPWLIVRVTGGGMDVFQSYDLGITERAIVGVFQCAEDLY